MAICGVGTDVVDIARFERALRKAPGLVERLFAAPERGLPVESLAARFAAKEAVAKALGSAGNLCWHDVIVHKASSGKPFLELRNRAAEVAATKGIAYWHISLTHDGGLAMAFVIAETQEVS